MAVVYMNTLVITVTQGYFRLLLMIVYCALTSGSPSGSVTLVHQLVKGHSGPVRTAHVLQVCY
jgi:hypothetical protein